MSFLTLSSFAAVADARQIDDAAMTSGSAILTSAAAAFVEEDVGKSIVVAGAGTAAAKLCTTIVTRTSQTEVTLSAQASTTVEATGATFGTDCGTALQAALTAVKTGGGGGLVIDGHFMLNTPVTQDFTVGNSPVLLLGYGSSSRLYVAMTSSSDSAITIQNAQHLTVQGLTVVGTQKETRDAAIVFDVQGCSAVFRDNGFYGVATNATYGALIKLTTGNLSLENNHFGGCTGSSAFGASCVIADDFESVKLRNNRFIDYGMVGSILFTKTNLDAGYAWVLILDPANNRVGNLMSEGDFYDEGALYGIRVEPGPAIYMANVHIKGSQSNPSTAGRGYYISQVDNVTIEDCNFGFIGTPPVELFFCRTAVLRNLRLVDGANALVAGGAVTIQEHDVYRINANTSRTAGFGTYTLTNGAKVIAFTNGKSSVEKAGPISDADFRTPPPNGFFGGTDTLNGRAYFKVGGVWKYALLI